MNVNPHPVIGLLGGIGSGKSAVAAELARHGGHVINADQFGHEALRQPDIHEQVVARFGADIRAADGVIDRKKLGAIVFADADELRALEAIVFPFIGRRIREEIDRAGRRDGVRFIVLDAAVMLEAGWSDVCDRLIFVAAPRAVRVERVQKKRGWSEAELQSREKLQMPVDEKRRRADAVVDNASTLAALGPQVTALVQGWGLSSAPR
ncbi:MAG: dephospho-CoA kinase [Gemmataceae bacterium]|nr:dephospho-CoA kinase [Gemmataceae bacterium]